MNISGFRGVSPGSSKDAYQPDYPDEEVFDKKKGTNIKKRVVYSDGLPLPGRLKRSASHPGCTGESLLRLARLYGHYFSNPYSQTVESMVLEEGRIKSLESKSYPTKFCEVVELVSRLFEVIKGDVTKIRDICRRLPKADLHTHNTGAVYPADWMRLALLYDLLFNPHTLRFTDKKLNGLWLRAKDSLGEYSEKLTNKTTVKGVVEGADPHSSFYNSFQLCEDIADVTNWKDKNAPVFRTNHEQNVSLVEERIDVCIEESEVPSTWKKAFDNANLSDEFFESIFNTLVTEHKSVLDSKIQATKDQLAQCIHSDATTGKEVPYTDIESPVVFRYFVDISRENDFPLFCANLIFAVRLYQEIEGIIGFDIAGDESSWHAIISFQQQIKFIEYLEKSGKLEDIHIVLHTGELTVATVKDKRWFENRAIETLSIKIGTRLRRLGHLCSIERESRRTEVLNELLERDIAVELNIGTNEIILGYTKGKREYLKILKKAGIPLIPCSDDEGYTKIDLTEIYVKLILEEDFTIHDIIECLRNGIRFSCLKGEEIFQDRPVGKLSNGKTYLKNEYHLKKAFKNVHNLNWEMDEEVKNFLRSNEKAAMQVRVERDLAKIFLQFIPEQILSQIPLEVIERSLKS
ncbi:MAG: hypothetical protein KDK72_05800 [Chlamydiia bacterium]|nr:hypothetical protein [Chlamydiia bacterium]